ncbi:hypothetical protein ZIOFF_071714 [Zingiber officinale]|uniref:Uncharacterized protein n=1 Tax=Zingiber officinale TaxID=94328 RepID=A0A8J5C9Y7_ZINOF|nr:hypothetical protein ZIOFF_071714 [Zingiber officinale]
MVLNADFCLDNKLKGLLNMHLNEHTTFPHCEDECLLDISSTGLLASHFMCHNLLITSVSFQARDYRIYIALFEILSQKDQMPSETYHDLLLLLENHDDLLKELMRFKPHDFERRISHHNSSGMSLFLVSLFILSLILMFEQPLRCFIQQTLGT